jgi:hypothetical protein
VGSECEEILESEVIYMRKIISIVTCAYLITCVFSRVAEALDLRIVDAKGLIRAVRVVKDKSKVTVSVIDQVLVGGECVALNVDGIASERREKLSSSGDCVFEGLVAGTWQVSVTSSSRWRVKIDG